MSTLVELPDSVNNELLSFLATLYPELEKDGAVSKTVSIVSSKEPKIRYEARVRYRSRTGQFSSHLKYAEVDNFPNGYSYSWYRAIDDND